MAKIKVIWKKSGIGYAKDQNATIAALGLRKLNSFKIHDDNPVIRGMIHKVRHLVEVQEVN